MPQQRDGWQVVKRFLAVTYRVRGPIESEKITLRAVPGSNATGTPFTTSGFTNADPMFVSLSSLFGPSLKERSTIPEVPRYYGLC